MASAIKVLSIGTQDLGVLPRELNAHYLSDVDWLESNQKQARALIQPDQNGEYNITDNIIGTKTHGELYDDGTKVLEWHSTPDGRLIVQSYTEKQINLFAALKTKECFFKAKGPVYIKGSLEIESLLAIDAEALWLDDEITSKGAILLKARQGIGLLAPVKSESLVIDAAYVHQAADIRTAGQFDVCTQFFKQNSSVKTVVDKLRLISTASEMNGDFTINNECFLTSKSLILGHETESSTFRFPGSNHIHTGNLHLRGDTQVRIGNLALPQEGLFLVDEQLVIDERAVAHVFNTKSPLNQIENNGELVFEQCHLEAQRVQQHGIFDASNSLIKLSDSFTHANKALTELKNCHYIVPTTYVHDNDFSMSESVYKGKLCKIHAGSLEFNYHSEIEIEALLLDKEAEAIVRDSKFKAATSLKSMGRLLFEKADIETKYFKTREGQLSSKNSNITAETAVELNGATDLSESRIAGDTLILNGELVIDKAHFQADSLNITSQKANINSLFSKSKRLQITGSDAEEQIVFKGCGFTIELLECTNHITLDNSTIYGVSEKVMSHPLHSHLKVRRSKFLTDDDIRNYLDGQIELEDNSLMKVRLLHSQGAMKAKDSKVFCEHLKQENASLKLEASIFAIADKLSSQNSTVELSEGSVLGAFDVELEDNSKLVLKEDSTLVADSQLANASDSTIMSTDSKVQAKKFTALGRTELCSSLLSAKELSIYEQFSAHSLSAVTVEGLIEVALEAQAKLENSMLTGGSVSTLGKMDVTNSSITVQNELEIYPEAFLALGGRAQVDTNNMLVMGSLAVHADPKEEPSPEQTGQELEQEKPKFFINVHQELTVAEEGSITGKGNLWIEANQYQHTGSIDLSGKLGITGNTLTNQGSIEAEKVFLGFDSQVQNSGSLSAEDMVIHSNFLNLLGRTYAKKSLSVAGFYGANGGLIAANNYSNTTLLSVNAGLITPNLSGKASDIISWANLGSVAKIAATTLIPSYSNTINLACMTYGLISSEQGLSLYNMISGLNLDHYKQMRTHELMAELSCLKGLVSTAYNAANMAYGASFELSNLSNDFISAQSAFNDNPLSLYDIKSAASRFDYKNFGMRSAGVLLGGYNDDSLINLNFGSSVSPNTAKRSLFSFNSGAEFSAFSHNISNQVFFNSGWSGGSDASFSTQYGYNEGTLEGLNRFYYKADSTVNTGSMIGEQAYVVIDSLEQEGTLHLSRGFAKIDQFTDTEAAVTEFADMFVGGTDYESKGHLEAQRTFLDYEHQIKMEESSTAQASHLSMRAGEIILAGKLQHEDGLFIEADKVTFTENSVVHGQRTAEEELFVIKSTPDQETEVAQETSTTETAQEQVATTDDQPSKVKKEFNPNHVLQIKAKEVVLDGAMSGGDYTLIQGIENKPEPSPSENTSVSTPEDAPVKKSPKLDKLTIGEHAEITLSYGSIAGHEVVNDGHINLDSFSLEIDSLQQNNSQVLDSCSGEITQFRDSEKSSTTVTQSALTGERFTSAGTLDSQKTSFHYRDEFLTTKTSTFKSDDTWITTDHFQVEGKIDYQHLLSVKAETVSLQAGSSINGKKTAEDELFVTKENPVTSVDTPTQTGETSEKKEEKKEFNPQHILAIETKKVHLDGKLTGGDFTSIHGKPIEAEGVEEKTEKCELVEIGTSAEIDLTHGFISAQAGDVTGSAHLSGFDLDIDHTKIHHSGHLSLEKSIFNGTSLNNVDGTLSLDHSDVTLNEMILSQYGREHIIDSTVTTDKLVDYSQLSYQGQAAFFTKHYEHGGRVSVLDLPKTTEIKNLFAVQADTANLHGSSNLDNAIFDIKHLANANQFISGSGQYSSYGVSGLLEFDTADYMDLNLPFYRLCDLTVKASGITLNSDYITSNTLKLISTESDITLLKNVSGVNIYMKSAGAIKTNHQIYAAQLACFEADGGFYNVGGGINGNIVSIKASEIINVTPGSVTPTPKSPGSIFRPKRHDFPGSHHKTKDKKEPAPNPWGIDMGTEGIINGRSETYMEATTGNIVNCGGIIRGGAYTQLIAQGDVINKCNVATHRGAYDRITTFDPGLIAGGSGLADTEGVGLYIKANGMVRSDASNFISNGSNYIYGLHGIDLGARQETHISKVKKTKNWYGKSSESVTTTTSISHSNVQSFGGVNTLVAEEGGVKSVATHFVSPGGTQISSRDSVLLYSLKAQSKKHKSSSSLWGLSKHSIDETHEEVAPTLFVDNGVTRVYSTQGSIDARGAYFVGNGDLDMRAEHGRIQFGVDILDHEVIEKSRGIGVSVPGMGAWNSWKNGGSIYDAMSAEDATLSKLNSMLGSNNTTELLANASNLGINLYNTTNSLMRGLSENNLTGEILARYGLGGTDGKGFSPTINVTMTESTTKTKYQTQGVGGVNRGGNVYLEAGEGIDLENGVRVHAGGNMVVNAPEIVARSAELHSSVDQTVTSQSIGVSPTGQIQDASFAYSHTSTKSTQHVNAELSAGGHMELGYKEGAMDQVTLDGARIIAGSLDAKIEHLSIIDKQDTSVTETKSGQVSLSGQVSAYVGKGDSAVVREHSGIYVANNTGHSVVIDDAHMKGGEMLVNGGSVEITKLVSEKVVDHQSYTGVGISFNVNDLQRWTGQQASNTTGEQAIAVGEVTFDKVDRIVEHTPVVYGENGVQIVIKEVVGEVHTESASGAKVLKNDEMHVNLDVPITNSDYIQKSVDNIKSGVEKITTALGLTGIPETKLPEQKEPVLPSRREEEEEEEEELGEKAEKDTDVDKKDQKSPLSEEEAVAAFQELFSLISEGDASEIAKTSVQLQEALEKGDGASELKEKFKAQLLSALNKVVKASSEDMWEGLAQKIGADSADKLAKIFSAPDGLSTKAYMGSRGTIYISFIFNLYGASLDGKKDVWDTAMKNTVGDLIINYSLKVTTGSAAGPIGWALVGIGVLDTLLYDEKVVELFQEQGKSLAEEGIKQFDEGNYTAAATFMHASQEHTQAYWGAQVMHYLADLSFKVSDRAISNLKRLGHPELFDDMILDRIKPKLPVVDPITPESRKVNRHSFFCPEEAVKRHEQTTLNQSVNEVGRTCEFK